jgi:uncharacterized RDD family membrane protein YckC
MDEYDSLTIQGADAVEYAMPIAGVGSRCYAFTIDWHIRVILALTWAALGWFVAELGGFDELSGLIGYVFWLPSVALYFLYHPVLEIAMQGRTPGKRMAGVRIVDVHGHTPGVGALLMRNVFRLVDALPAFYGLGLVVAMLTQRQVRIGDIAAGTLLIHEEKVTAQAFRRSTRLLLDQRLTPAQQEFLQDLLERWPQLDQAVRARFARALLAELGEPLPAEKKPREEDRALRLRLQQLAGYET